MKIFLQSSLVNPHKKVPFEEVGNWTTIEYHHHMIVTALVLAQQAVAPIQNLDDYLKLDTGKPSWSLGPKSSQFVELRLTSLTWQGDQWHHEIVIAGSKINSDVVILNLTGDRMESTMDDFTALFSKQTRLPVVTVYGVPNQPVFGVREDELVSIGYTKFFSTQDNTWPLLLPMTKSALRAMDAIQEWSKGKIKKFIVTGTSKRGATSWLVASTGDKRIVGIVPMVADTMMDFTRQLETCKKEWGYLSPIIPEFKTFNPIPFFKSPRGVQLSKLQDPYFQLSKVKVPALIINATNDQFTVIDSTKLYWDDIKSPKIFKMIPNETHFFAIPNARHGGYSRAASIDAMNAVRFFADCLTGTDKLGLPNIEDKSDPRRRGTRTWGVAGETAWVQESKWSPNIPSSSAPFTATFEDVTYTSNGYSASFSSLVTTKRQQK